MTSPAAIPTSCRRRATEPRRTIRLPGDAFPGRRGGGASTCNRGEDDGTLGTESDSDGTDASAWDDGAIQQLGWDRFKVTDPEVFSDVDEAFEAGDYDQAQALIDDWKSKNVEKEDQFDGPNAPKRKRRNQTPAGRTMDHDDIRADSSSIAFELGRLQRRERPAGDLTLGIPGDWPEST